MEDLEGFFTALRSAAQQAGLSLDTVWKYTGGSPLAFRQAVLERGPKEAAMVLGFTRLPDQVGLLRVSGLGSPAGFL